ncbi:hypothetical protein [Solitalea lacus]|uniref:hypothetical protein n=1 Tax=Solitalea lacus TaxID=2911172 RepID=UPI001EDC0BBD|nr:hypothetical protein [Solitalea lacus]UKJ06735.1 hypothetical protein L2B55_14500 [Solitalea lacus]
MQIQPFSINVLFDGVNYKGMVQTESNTKRLVYNVYIKGAPFTLTINEKGHWSQLYGPMQLPFFIETIGDEIDQLNSNESH